MIVCGGYVSLWSQMVVSDPGVTTAVGILTGQVSGIIAKDATDDSLVVASDTAKRLEQIAQFKDVLKKSAAIGNVVYSAGQNVQDVVDTANDISELFTSSPVLNKSLKEMTEDEMDGAFDELNEVRAKAVSTLTDFRTFGSNFSDRVSNVGSTIESIDSMLDLFGKNINPDYAKLKEIGDGISTMNRHLTNVIGTIQGQSINDRIMSELDIVEKKLVTDQETKEEQRIKAYKQAFRENALVLAEDVAAIITEDIDLKKARGSSSDPRAAPKPFHETYNW